MQVLTSLAFVLFSGLVTSGAAFAGPAVGAAPKGDSLAVAGRIIKYDFPPGCRSVSGARRSPDGSIRAQCNGVNYLVFTVFNAKEGKTIEVALNCAASKKLLDMEC